MSIKCPNCGTVETSETLPVACREITKGASVRCYRCLQGDFEVQPRCGERGQDLGACCGRQCIDCEVWYSDT